MFPPGKRQKYAKIVSEENATPEKSQTLCRNSIGWVLIGVISVLCLTLGLVILVYYVQRSGFEDGKTSECGVSLADFKKNGCVFDVLSYNWMPARCKDNATSEEFQFWLSDPQRVLGPWPFFKDMSENLSLAENRISSEVDFGARLDMDIYSSLEEHIAHCMFLFLHVSRAALGETPVWSSNTYPHAEHCFHAIWKALNGTWNINDDRRANHKIAIEVATC